MKDLNRWIFFFQDTGLFVRKQATLGALIVLTSWKELAPVLPYCLSHLWTKFP